jgi:superfamily II DNA or RNA helicase
MNAVELNEALLAKAAGWEAMKRARALLDNRQVLSSNWTPPILKGVVQDGSISYRAGLVIKSPNDIENMCGCRDSRQWGTICAHSVGVGLHHLRRQQLEAGTVRPAMPTPPGLATRPPPAPAVRKTSLRVLRRAEDGTTGQPCRLHVILPPNLPQALSRGVIMVCIEGETSRGRMPLGSVDKSPPYSLSTPDERLLAHLEELAGETPSVIQLKTDAFADLLGKLAGHERVTLGKGASVEVGAQPWTPPLCATLEANGEIRLALAAGAGGHTVLSGARPWVFAGGDFKPLGLAGRCQGVLAGPVRLSRAEVPFFLGQEFSSLLASGTLSANFKLEDFQLSPQPPRFLLALAGGLSQLTAVLQCAYGPRIMTLGVTSQNEAHWLPDPGNPRRYSTRDPGAEQTAQQRLRQAGFSPPDGQGRWQLSNQSAVLGFFARDYPRWCQQWEVTLEERLNQTVDRSVERVEPALQITPSGENWFELQVDYRSSSGERFSAADIQRLLLAGQSHRRLANGKFALIDTGAVEELQQVLVDCAPRQQDGRYRLANLQAGFLTATVREQTGWQLQAPAAWQQRFGGTGDQAPQCPPLGPLEAQLRPYQKTGVAWMNFLYRNGSGGILADEMGLGKTVQALAFLSSLAAEGRRPFLIVCPTSLVFNWVAEAQRFTPGLKVLPLHGPGRSAHFAEIPRHDIIITSYALIRRDAELYRECEFEVAVLDEAQHIKNRATQNAQAVKTIRSRCRFVLTGTPMENSVLDLWSIFDFLLPGYLGDARDFRERYELPITREKDAATRTRLARRIRPFLLRRLKRDVVRDLPEKIEQVSFCDLNDAQTELYRQVLEAGRKEITEAVGAQGLAKSRMLVFTTLLRLRQICCDLRLLKLEGEPVAAMSGKLELFGELLEEAIDGGHRVLVFSQFTTLLALIQEHLKAEEIEYCYLDGSTTNRAEVVERFQKTATIPVFLLSLKAGGVGLNLTGADTVIHLDPWWNPAVEDQATDRAHRIGQRRVVTSYKLITRGTVEEKILSLQQRKRELLKGALGDEEALSNLLTWDEITDLIS